MIILLGGKRGAGKSAFAEIAKKQGYKVREMSAIVKGIMEREGIEVNNRNLRLFARGLREKFGKGIVGQLMAEQMEGGKEVIVGIRAVEEIEEIKKRFSDVVVVFIDAPANIRFERMGSAGKKENPVTWDEFLWADSVDNELGQEGVMEAADIVINNSKSKKEFEEEAKRVLRWISRPQKK
ncbi:MAG: hypothetical protein QW035_00420 [Candidatus Anstonellales archaeon]